MFVSGSCILSSILFCGFVVLVWLGSLEVSVSDPITARTWVRSLTTALSSNNLGQVVHKPQPVGAMPQFGGPAD